MDKPKDINENLPPAPHVPSVPADQDEGSEERREAGDQSWKDRAGVPRGTPEQGEKSADRVGGSGAYEPEPEIEDDENQSASKRTPGTDDDERNKRRASEDDDVS